MAHVMEGAVVLRVIPVSEKISAPRLTQRSAAALRLMQCTATLCLTHSALLLPCPHMHHTHSALLLPCPHMHHTHGALLLPCPPHMRHTTTTTTTATLCVPLGEVASDGGSGSLQASSKSGAGATSAMAAGEQRERWKEVGVGDAWSSIDGYTPAGMGDKGGGGRTPYGFGSSVRRFSYDEAEEEEDGPEDGGVGSAHRPSESHRGVTWHGIGAIGGGSGGGGEPDGKPAGNRSKGACTHTTDASSCTSASGYASHDAPRYYSSLHSGRVVHASAHVSRQLWGEEHAARGEQHGDVTHGGAARGGGPSAERRGSCDDADTAGRKVGREAGREEIAELSASSSIRRGQVTTVGRHTSWSSVLLADGTSSGGGGQDGGGQDGGSQGGGEGSSGEGDDHEAPTTTAPAAPPQTPLAPALRRSHTPAVLQGDVSSLSFDFTSPPLASGPQVSGESSAWQRASPALPSPRSSHRGWHGIALGITSSLAADVSVQQSPHLSPPRHLSPPLQHLSPPHRSRQRSPRRSFAASASSATLALSMARSQSAAALSSPRQHSSLGVSASASPHRHQLASGQHSPGPAGHSSAGPSPAGVCGYASPHRLLADIRRDARRELLEYSPLAPLLQARNAVYQWQYHRPSSIAAAAEAPLPPKPTSVKPSAAGGSLMRWPDRPIF